MEDIVKELQIELNAIVSDRLGESYKAVILKEKQDEEKGELLLHKIYPHFCHTIGYSDELKKCIEGTVDKLFDPTGDPNEEKKPGLLLGKIQSGKTRAFVGCMARAFDEKKVAACIILTKGTKPLVNQTISRMKYDFRDCLRGAKPKRFPTVSIYDIMKKRKGLQPSQINGELNIFVCKKQKDNMRILIDVFHNSEFKNKSILVIDDEADFVSRSFIKKRKAIYEGMIASQIDQLIEGLPNARYLQVTATPYSLYLQPDNYVDLDNNNRVMPFRPRFTSLVPVHDQYVGSVQYFGEASEDKTSMYSCLYHETDPECVDRLYSTKRHKTLYDNVVKTKKLFDLRWSIVHYVTASAIRQIQNDGDYNTSYIMHVGTEQSHHDWEYDLIEHLLDQWGELINKGKINDTSVTDFSVLFEAVLQDVKHSIGLGRNQFNTSSVEQIKDIPSRTDIEKRVLSLISEKQYTIEMVNSDNDVESLLDEDGQLELALPLNIFIGGFVLDRGITISHLLGFFYGREPRISQQATLLQHCRMFGSRSKADMAVTRLFANKTLYDVLKKVNQMDDLMRERFEKTINDPNADPGIEFIHCNKAEGIIPCNPSSVAISDLVYWKPLSYVLPEGMQTTSSKKVKEAYLSIQNLISNRKNKSFSDISRKDAISILESCFTQFEYSKDLDNINQKGTIDHMINLLKKLVGEKDTLIVYVRNNGNTGRVRSDGKGWIDAPMDGQTESPLVKANATTKPVLMLIEQKGNKDKGWKGDRFYWPVICLPSNVPPIVYSLK